MSAKYKMTLLDIVLVILLCLFSSMIIFPFLHIIAVSFSDAVFTARGEVNIIPKGLNLASYKTMFHDIYFLRGYANTVYYSLLGTFIVLFLTSLTAYPLAQKRFNGKNFLTAMYAFTMFFGGGMIPTYLVVRSLGLLNTVWSVTLTNALGVWYIIIFRTFFKNIPDSLSESAFIDGANDWIILYRIVLPLSKPILATIGLFTIVARWNDFFTPFLYLTDPYKFPVSIVLRRILLDGDMRAMVDSTTGAVSQEEMLKTTSTSLQYAAIMIAVFPIMCVYPFIQKYFVKGIMIGSIKG